MYNVTRGAATRIDPHSIRISDERDNYEEEEETDNDMGAKPEMEATPKVLVSSPGSDSGDSATFFPPGVIKQQTSKESLESSTETIK